MIYKAVLFDMDGVILDSEPMHVAAFHTTLKSYGKELADDQYKKHFAGKTDEAGFKDYFKFINESVDLPAIMDAKAKAYLRLAADQLVPYAGIPHLLKRLSTEVPLALVTGSLRDEVDVTLESLGIKECFKVIVTANDVSVGKPGPEGYLKAANLLGKRADECVIIEDSPSGVEAANNAGIKCIGITNTHTKSDLAKADIIVEQLNFELF